MFFLSCYKFLVSDLQPAQTYTHTLVSNRSCWTLFRQRLLCAILHREHSQNPASASTRSGMWLLGASGCPLPGYKVATTVFSTSLAAAPGARVMLVILTQIHTGLGGASLAPEHAAHPMLPGSCSTQPSGSAKGWKTPSQCLHHLLFALFEFLFAFTSQFLCLHSALPWFRSLLRTHLILFICLFCSFSFHPSDKPVLSPLSAPVSSSRLQ